MSTFTARAPVQLGHLTLGFEGRGCSELPRNKVRDSLPYEQVYLFL